MALINFPTVMRQARRMMPVALLYLVMSQEALAVHRNIQLTTAFIKAPTLPRNGGMTRWTQPKAVRGLSMANSDCSTGLCPSKLMALAVTGFGLLSAASPVKADDVAPVQVSRCSAIRCLRAQCAIVLCGTMS